MQVSRLVTTSNGFSLSDHETVVLPRKHWRPKATASGTLSSPLTRCWNLRYQCHPAVQKFQEDLFYRLDGLKIRIPPLRERLDDIPELVDHFITRHSRAMRKRVTAASSETIRLLMAAQWKGNVRQLDNAIERAVIMCEGTSVEPSDLPPDLIGMGHTDDLRSALRHYEKLHITRVLRQWPDKREAAKRLRLGLSSLYRKIEELEIEL